MTSKKASLPVYEPPNVFSTMSLPENKEKRERMTPSQKATFNREIISDFNYENFSSIIDFVVNDVKRELMSHGMNEQVADQIIEELYEGKPPSEIYKTFQGMIRQNITKQDFFLIFAKIYHNQIKNEPERLRLYKEKQKMLQRVKDELKRSKQQNIKAGKFMRKKSRKNKTTGNKSKKNKSRKNRR